MRRLKLKFHPTQKHQKIAVESVVNLFIDLPPYQTSFQLDDETIPNLQFIDNDIFICLDNNIIDEEEVILADKALIKTI